MNRGGWIKVQWPRTGGGKEMPLLENKKQRLIKIWLGKLFFWRMLDPIRVKCEYIRPKKQMIICHLT